VLGKRPDHAERDHLVGEAGAPVRALRYPELDVEPQQVLLDRRLGHHKVDRDLLRRGGRHERVIGKRGTAQRDEHVELAPCQLRSCGAPQLGLGRQFLLRQSPDPAARGPERKHVTVVKYPTGDWPPVYPRAIT